MARKYLKSEEIIKVWNLHKKGISAVSIAAQFEVSSTTISNWVKDIESLLSGLKVIREKGGHELKVAVQAIKSAMANCEAKSEKYKKLLSAIEEYVDEEVKVRISKLSEIVK